MTFQNESKIWVCKGLNGELEDYLYWISLNVAKDCHATVNFCELFNLNFSTELKNGEFTSKIMTFSTHTVVNQR